ncbi:MAG: selenocysteine-specific translation elongation factor [Acidobacteria bacterium]|nr:selenocysteine-specific translation elongation factor [Acidobacteriota bacterium]
MKNIIIGTAGHIDHGKTSLVKALTGIDADRLKEEKQRGITIDIGFADLVIDDCRFGFVDVPGHERFVKNMLAGAHGIDLVILVIAADEAVMPQTKEHFDICRLLEVKTGLTVLTKADLVDEELLELAKDEVRDFVSNSFLASAPIIPLSCKTGQGITELKDELLKLANKVTSKNTLAVSRLPIDRAFTIKGFGTVVTGTLTSGELEIGQELEILPGKVQTKVRGIQVHNLSAEKAFAGQRSAINLQGISLEEVGRGQVLVPAKRFQVTSILDVELELLPNLTKSLTQRTRVRLHHETSEIMARVVLLGGSELIPGEKMFAQLRLEEPTFALPGDRFIVRSYSPQITIGGGRIIDALPSKHRLKDLKAVEWLRKLADSNEMEKIALFVEMSGIKAMSVADIRERTGLTDTLLNKELSSLTSLGRLLKSDSQQVYFLAKTAYEQLKVEFLKLVRDFHKREPLQVGINREEVREKIGFTQEIFKLVLERLALEKLIVSEKDLLRLASHQISLSSEDEQVKKQMETKFKEVNFQARTYDEVMKEFRLDQNKLRKIYQLLVNEQNLVKIADFVFHKEAINEIIERIKGQKAKNTKLDVATFKDLTGLSRKYAIPLLEYLDTQKITRRVGNDREIL